MLTDWTVTIATPLTIQNRLPLEMSITVMQHDDVTTFTAPAGSLMSLHGVHPGACAVTCHQLYRLTFLKFYFLSFR